VFKVAWFSLTVAVVTEAVARLARWVIVPTVAIVTVLVALGTLSFAGIVEDAYPIWSELKAVSSRRSAWITDSATLPRSSRSLGTDRG
jgi:hypothetical protein